MKVLYIILSLSLIISSCGNNTEPNLEIAQTGCLDENLTSLTVDFNCKVDPESNFCDTHEFDFMPIKLEHKLFFPEFCYDINDAIIFEDKSGNQTSAIVKKKSFKQSIFEFIQLNNCPHDIFDGQRYCMKNEVARLSFEGEFFDIDMRLQTLLTADDASTASFGTNIYITDENQSGFIIYHIINDIDDQFGFKKYELFYDSITLNNHTYKDVFSFNTNEGTGVVEKAYFNETYGLIGLKDSSGKLWIEK